MAEAGVRADGHVRRADYTPVVMQEMFIVPLLRRLIDQALTTYAAPNPGNGTRSALDVGCGRQPFRKTLESMGYRYVGMDVQQNQDQSVDLIGPIDAPMRDAMKNAGTFQFILCTEVLEHVADWNQAFENLTSLLAPGGKMLMTCPFVYPLHEEPYDYWRPTRHALAYFAQRNGLRIVEQQAAGSGWDVWGTVLGGVIIMARSNSFWHRLMRNMVATVRKLLVSFIRSGFPQRLADLGGGMYLSNFIVLERP